MLYFLKSLKIAMIILLALSGGRHTLSCKTNKSETDLISSRIYHKVAANSIRIIECMFLAGL